MIIKQSVVDVLMFLFEQYLDDDDLSETAQVTAERDNIQVRLEEFGFQNPEINQAFDWLEDLADESYSASFSPLNKNSIRIYSEVEKKLLDQESISFLQFLEQSAILTPTMREFILDRVVALGHPLDVEQLRWIVMIVLHTHSSDDNTHALMESFIFDDFTGLVQ